jgi:aminoglycoside phosphotransferase
MLEVALADPVTPGSNRRADVVGSSWLLLLPQLHHGRVALEGRVDPATRRAVAAVADEVVDGGATPDASAALVVVGAGADPERARRWVAPGGAVHHLPGAPVLDLGPATSSRLVAGSVPASLAAGAGPSLLAVPFAPRDPAAERRPLARAARVVARASRRLGHPIGTVPGPERSGVVVVPGASGTSTAASLWRGDVDAVDRPPAWLLEHASTHGFDLARHRYRFIPGGDYWSQKAVFLLHPPGADQPDLAVKVGRDRRFSGRLATERDALRHVAGRASSAAAVPTVAFWAEEDGVVVLAQSALGGAPLPDPLVDDPIGLIRRAGDALLDLAIGGGGPGLVGPGDAAAALGGIVDRFAVAHPERTDLVAALRTSVDAVAADDAPFPSVFHHGDAGVWNLLVEDDGRIGVLDWENAETGGVPLWDLFYLHQTRSSRLAVAAGHRYGSRRFADDFLADGPNRRLLVAEIDRWLASIPLRPTLVEPLFRLCWAHHAAKEASRTPPGRARRRGRYLGILDAVVGATTRF